MNFQIEQHKKVLVTGGTGFIAGWIIKQLVESDVCVHATVPCPFNCLPMNCPRTTTAI
mgnify:CR=1 FL=1